MDFETRFELERTKDFIKNHHIVCLQFPDHLLPFSQRIYKYLKNDSNQVFILADSTFGNCCVDSVATRHVDTAAIIHYGNACLSTPKTSLNILYVFEKQEINLSALNSEISKYDQVLILTATDCYHIMDKLDQSNCIKSHINTVYPSTSPNFKHQLKEFHFDSEQNFKEISVLYIGSSTVNTSLLAMQFKDFSYFNPKTSKITKESLNNALFKKRFLQIQKVKDCNVIGIVVGTLSVGKFKSPRL